MSIPNGLICSNPVANNDIANIPRGFSRFPLITLRIKSSALDTKTKYIVYCDSGRRSSAAAFLLSERGLQVYCLKGGLVERTGD